jgi:hypothetical protein
MAFQNPFKSPVFKWVGFPMMLIAAALLAWSIGTQMCGEGHKIGLYPPDSGVKP